jgi:DNA ligase 1
LPLLPSGHLQENSMFHRRTVLTGVMAMFATPLAATVTWAKTTRAELLLAQNYEGGVDVSQYWVSEKLDGVRALWDGKQLKFRSGRLINAPAWFTAKLPATPLDGELWMGRGRFDVLSGAVRKAQPVDEEWRRINYMLFELPSLPAGQGGDFSKRIAAMKEIVAQVAWPQLQAVAQFRVNSEAELKNKLKEVVSAGGEGLMLHLASSAYTTGRSPALLKLKPEQDAEATVVAHQAGKGKYAGQLGALLVRNEEGKRFRIGSGLPDELRAKPPAVGSTITYSYRGLTPSGVPRFASFVRVRERE